LLASQKTLSEILTKAKFKKTASIEQAQFTGKKSTLSVNQEQILKEQSKAKNNLAEAQMEQRVGEQLAEIQAKKIELVNKMNKAQMAMLEQKINMLGSAFDVVSKEYKSKQSQDFQKRLEELRENARTLSPKELTEKTENLIGGMDFLLEGLPETLGELRWQLLKAASDLEQQTNLLVASDEKPEKEEPPKE
jgi:arginyl-tRNA synthetase